MNFSGMFGSFAPATDDYEKILGEYYDPKGARWNAAGSALQGLGVGLLTKDWAKAAEVSNAGMDDYRKQAVQKMQISQLMQQAEENRRKREEEAQALKQRNEFLATLPSDVQMKARSIPGFLEDYVKATDPTFQTPMDPNDRYKAVGGNIYDVETGQWVQGPGGGMGQGDLPKGYRWKADGSGAEPIPGVSLPGTNMRLTQDQSKSLAYYKRGEAALPALEEGETALTSLKDTGADAIPLLGNYMTSPEYKKAAQAGREFLAAVLRKDTGAAITKQEMEIYGKMYLPQPGDDAGVLAQKKQARRVALDAIKSGLGTAETLAGGSADAPDGVAQEEWNAMTPEERALWQ